MLKGFMLTVFFRDGTSESVFGQSLTWQELHLFVNAPDAISHSTHIYDMSAISSFTLYPHTVSLSQLQDGLVISGRFSSPGRVSNGF